MDRPLEGIRVLDLTRLLPGGFATQLLADLGADVIKVEEPGQGDYMRYAPPTRKGVSYAFLLVNQGKRSVAINLKAREGRDLFHRLASTADVLMEQFRPGVAKRLGVGYDQVKRVRQDIIYCSLSGYGASGTLAKRPGHDLNFQALAGILHMNARDGRPFLPGIPAADMMSGAMAAYSILAALFQRERTGRGVYIDLSILDAAFQLNLINLAEGLAGHDPSPGRTFITGLFPFYGVYETADGRFITLAPIEEKFWTKLCRLIGRPDFAEKHTVVGKEADGVRAEISSIIRQRTLRDWQNLLAESDIPYAPVLTVPEALETQRGVDPGILQEVPFRGELITTLAHPARWVPEGPKRVGTAPHLGEHTLEVLGEIGVPKETVREMASGGIVGMAR